MLGVIDMVKDASRKSDVEMLSWKRNVRAVEMYVLGKRRKSVLRNLQAAP